MSVHEVMYCATTGCGRRKRCPPDGSMPAGWAKLVMLGQQPEHCCPGCIPSWTGIPDITVMVED